MLQRIANLFRGFFGVFVSGLERKNPEALLEVEKENLRKQMGQYNQGLATHAGLCEKLISEIRKQENQQRDLRTKTAASIKAGNRELAGRYALQLQNLELELAENRTQLELAEKTYQELVRTRDIAVASARTKLDALKLGINDLKMKRAMAELTEMASGMVGSMGSAGETLDRLHEIVEEERQKAAGRARVARDTMDTTGINLKESEQKAMADLALADFEAKEGISLNSETAKPSNLVTPPNRKMGPDKPLKQ